MRARQLVCLFVCVAALIASPVVATASMLAVDFAPPIESQVDYYEDDVAGFKFTVGTDDIVVTDLGFFDRNQNGLFEAHPVGIYEYDTEALVVSATVPSGTAGTLDSLFRFVSITPTTLTAATEYVIVGYRPTAGDPIAFNVSDLSVAPFITYDNNVAKNDTGGLVFAGEVFDVSTGWFGPNFKADIVPEPSSFALLGVGLFGVCVWMWRRRYQTV